MAAHSDPQFSHPAAWQQPPYGTGAGLDSSAEVGVALGHLTDQIQARIVEVESRHAEAMREMQMKLERMSGEAVKARPAMPADLATAFCRIEAGMSELVMRIAETAPERRKAADSFVFAPAKPHLNHFVTAPKPTFTAAPAFDGKAVLIGEHWDHEAAEALARLYESGDALLGKPLPEAALFAPTHNAALRAEAAQAQAMAETAPTPVAMPAEPAALVADVRPMFAGLGEDRDWIEQRFLDMTAQVSKSLIEARPDAALATLMSRVDQLETRFGTALDSLAKTADRDVLKPDALLHVEAQIKDLAQHIETTYQQLTRLDTIEQHLGDLTAFAHASLDVEGGQGTKPELAQDFGQLADLAVERAFARLPAAHVEGVNETRVQIDAVHGLLQDFVAERRKGDQYTTGMLDTVQEALIRLIDRVDAIDHNTTRVLEAHPVTVAATAAVPVSAPAFATPAAAAQVEASAPRMQRPTAAQLATPETVIGASALAVEAERAPQLAPRRPRRTVEVEAPIAMEPPTADIAADGGPAVLAAEAGARQEISIKDLRLKAKREALIEPPVGAAADTDADVAMKKPTRGARPVTKSSALASGGVARSGMYLAAAALGFAGVAYVGGLILADKYGPVPAETVAKTPMPTAVIAKQAGEPLPTAGTAAAAGQSAATPATLPSGPPGLIVTPKRAEPPAASGDNGNGALPQTQNSPGRRSDVEAPARAGQPASVPETVNDDLSMLEQDPTRPAAALSVTPATQKAPTGQISNAFVPMQGLLLDTSQPALRANELSGIQRQSGLAMTSEQVGMRARPASDFTGRFNEAARPAAAKPATNIASVAVNPPKPAASITTGSNPAVFAPVSFGDAPKPPQAPADSAVTDNATEAAELPPALIGPLSLRMAAAKGDASAAFEVASRLAEGRGIKQDFKQAMVWYQRSAAKGLAVAQYRLGTLYERGLGTNVDAARARIWYKRAADQGNVKAMHNMAVLSAGNDQAQPDYATAAKWFKEAADRGLADSQFNLGVLTENGLGVAKDPRAAYVWFSLAARGGDKEATRRRDLLQATLDEATLKSAEDQLRGWRAKPTDVKINDPRVAGDQWRNHAVQLDEPSSLPQPMPSQVANPAAAAPPQMPVQVPASRVSRTPLPAR